MAVNQSQIDRFSVYLESKLALYQQQTPVMLKYHEYRVRHFFRYKQPPRRFLRQSRTQLGNRLHRLNVYGTMR